MTIVLDITLRDATVKATKGGSMSRVNRNKFGLFDSQGNLMATVRLASDSESRARTHFLSPRGKGLDRLGQREVNGMSVRPLN